MRKMLTIIMLLLCASAGIAEAEPRGKYPDPTLTPGAILPLDEKTVCVEGYAIKERKKNGPSAKDKCAVMKSYGIDCKKDKPGEWQVDHLYPIKLAGDAGAYENLWPQAWPFWKFKDSVEFELIDRICRDKTMTLKEAQEVIRTDWYKFYLSMPEKEKKRHYDKKPK